MHLLEAWKLPVVLAQICTLAGASFAANQTLGGTTHPFDCGNHSGEGGQSLLAAPSLPCSGGPSSTLPSIGTFKSLVIPIHDSGTSVDLVSPADLAAYAEYFKDWYFDQSRSRLELEVTVADLDPGNPDSDWHVTSSSSLDTCMAISEALCATDNLGSYNFAEYDLIHLLLTRAEDTQGVRGGRAISLDATVGSDCNLDLNGKLAITISGFTFSDGPATPISERRETKVAMHETGHHFNLLHVSFQNTTEGEDWGYGSVTDTMGGGDTEESGYTQGAPSYGATAKERLGWFDSNQIEEVSQPGTYTITSLGAPEGVKAIHFRSRTHQIFGQAHVVVQYRGPNDAYGTPPASYYTASSGVELLSWGGFGQSLHQYDATPESGSRECKDGTLLPGRSIMLDTLEPKFFQGSGIVVTVESVDPIAGEATIRVDYTSRSDAPPKINGVDVQANGSELTLTADVNDPDGDDLVYFWTVGNGPFSGEFYQASSVFSGPQITIQNPPPGTNRVFLGVSDGRGIQSLLYPVDLDGSSLSIRQVPDEYATIQDALNDADPGDWVLVAPGTYSGPGNRDLDFQGKAVVLQSEQGADRTVLHCQGSQGIVLDSQEDVLTGVQGFKVRGAGSSTHGAGLFLGPDCAATIRHNVFEDCQAQINGGGLFASASVLDSNPMRQAEIRYNYFVNNAAGQNGGGLASELEYSRIHDNYFFDNTAENNGGGIWLREIAHFSRTQLGRNTADQHGGAIAGDRSVFLSSCIMHSNSADFGGGVAIGSGVNCSDLGQFRNSTFYANSASTSGGGTFLNWGSLEALNCIYHLNGPDHVASNSPVDCGTIDLSTTYTLGGHQLFRSPGVENFRLSSASPCIDIGHSGFGEQYDADGFGPVDHFLISDGDHGNGVDFKDFGAHELQTVPDQLPEQVSFKKVQNSDHPVAVINAQEVLLEWVSTPVGDLVDEYVIYRRIGELGPFDNIAKVAYWQTSYFDELTSATGLPSANLKLYYRVAAKSSLGEGPPSDTVLAAPLCAFLALDLDDVLRVDLRDYVVFSGLFVEPYERLSFYADLFPDGAIQLNDFINLQRWFLWIE